MRPESAKTNTSVREIPLAPNLEAVLRSLPSRASGGYVYVNGNGKPFGISKPTEALKRTIRRLRAEGYDVPVAGVHAFRHFFASYTLNKSDEPLNALELCRACGWRNVQMLMDTYYHADQKRLATKLAKLDYGENLKVAG